MNINKYYLRVSLMFLLKDKNRKWNLINPYFINKSFFNLRYDQIDDILIM